MKNGVSGFVSVREIRGQDLFFAISALFAVHSVRLALCATVPLWFFSLPALNTNPSQQEPFSPKVTSKFPGKQARTGLPKQEKPHFSQIFARFARFARLALTLPRAFRYR